MNQPFHARKVPLSLADSWHEDGASSEDWIVVDCGASTTTMC
jgi:ribosomal silencing factor RsfS